jgi:hypothetical protein
MYFTPYASSCQGCGTAFTASLQLIVNLNQHVPEFVLAGTPPFHDCESCNGRTMIDAPLLVLNFAGDPPALREPPLIFVPSDGSDQNGAEEELRYVAGIMKEISGKAWNDGLLERLAVTDRETLANAFRPD